MLLYKDISINSVYPLLFLGEGKAEVKFLLVFRTLPFWYYLYCFFPLKKRAKIIFYIKYKVKIPSKYNPTPKGCQDGIKLKFPLNTIQPRRGVRMVED